MMPAVRIRVSGVVQGVGFRPFVWRLATELNLAGWVRNDAQGVEVAAEGAEEQVAALLARLRTEAPALARVDTVSSRAAAPEQLRGFTIAPSAGGPLATAIGPDVAPCADCLRELFDAHGRRWRHPFITCTHCGPRYTVTRALPYDRPQTSLAPFPLCPDCEREYTSPADRRFHAETTCCPACGPGLSLVNAEGESIPGDPINATLNLLRNGAIVAIKGLGGFHLACDARNAAAVARLRLRKNREEKPFALMAANAVSLAGLAAIPAGARDLLESAERPVVLLDLQPGREESLPDVAPGLSAVGAMLPSTPIQLLLFHEAAGRPAGVEWMSRTQPLLLVMTSANPGGEPIVRDNAEARERLSGIADAILEHDRDIVARCDDSVVRAAQPAAPQFLRRSRGYAPAAIRLPACGPSVLAFGAHLKNAVCVTRHDEAFASPHVGDLDNAATCAFLDETVERMCHLLEVRPEYVAHDLHPDDYSTRAAIAFATAHGIPAIPVQHHHAHIAAVCAEHGWTSPVLGLALDGVGVGSDGTAWGGELLRVDGASFDRLGHLRPLPLPGGDRAARQPWRMGAAVLHELGRNHEIAARFSAEQDPAGLAGMLARGINCPRTSSAGRLFDAAAGLLRLCPHMKFEAQAAMLLEQAAARFIRSHGLPPALADGWRVSSDGELDLLPVLEALAEANDADAAAALFHSTLVAALANWVARAAEERGLRTVAWAGGCFLNRLLASGLREQLKKRGLKVLAPTRLSPGDGAIAVGQAWVAMQLATSQ